jgi:hypothetical protein
MKRERPERRHPRQHTLIAPLLGCTSLANREAALESIQTMGRRSKNSAPAHRLDEFPAGYSSAGYSPAGPASASPAEDQYVVFFFLRRGEVQRKLCRARGVRMCQPRVDEFATFAFLDQSLPCRDGKSLSCSFRTRKNVCGRSKDWWPGLTGRRRDQNRA